MKNILFILLLITSFGNAQQLAFPSAKGAGAYATGGSGGTILHVTTLAWNDNVGSLKWAIQQTYPRIVVFDVGGDVFADSQGDYSNVLNGYNNDNYNDLTIAGETAPNGGITIRTSFFRFESIDNIIIRNIRFRRSVTTGFNASTLWFRGCTNYIVDHCSFSHGADETFDQSSSNTPSFNGTIQNCLFSDNAKGMIIGTDTRGEAIPELDLGDFTFTNNAFANTSHRFPNTQGNGQFDIINNVVYNWKFRLTRITNQGTYNVMNNYYKGAINGIHRAGWFTNYDISNNYLNKLQVQSGETPLIHTSGSVIYVQRETPQTDDRDMWSIFDGSYLPVNSQVPDQFFTTTQFPLVGNSFTIKTAQQTYIDVLEDVGANKTLNADGSINLYQDSQDADAITMIKNDSYNGSWYDSVNTVPYSVIPQNVRPANFYVSNPHIPEAYLVARGITGNSNIHNVIQASGYDLMREYLHEIDGNIVTIPIQSVSIASADGNLIKGETLQLSLNFVPANTSNKTGVWSTNNGSIATVSQSGLINAVSEGTTTITFASNEDGNITASFVVSVTDEVNESGQLSKKIKVILISN